MEKKNTFTKALASIGCLLIGMFSIIYYFLYRYYKLPLPKLNEVTDTIHFQDTIPYYLPVPKDSTVLRYDTVTLPVSCENTHSDKKYILNNTTSDGNYIMPTDSSIKSTPDSVKVVIPITQKVYEDSTYKVWVSGYNPKVDSIFVYNKTNVVNHYFKSKEKHWGVGVQVGYGIGKNSLQPYIGIGINYNIVKW